MVSGHWQWMLAITPIDPFQCPHWTFSIPILTLPNVPIDPSQCPIDPDQCPHWPFSMPALTLFNTPLDFFNTSIEKCSTPPLKFFNTPLKFFNTCIDIFPPKTELDTPQIRLDTPQIRLNTCGCRVRKCNWARHLGTRKHMLRGSAGKVDGVVGGGGGKVDDVGGGGGKVDDDVGGGGGWDEGKAWPSHYSYLLSLWVVGLDYKSPCWTNSHELSRPWTAGTGDWASGAGMGTSSNWDSNENSARFGETSCGDFLPLDPCMPGTFEKVDAWFLFKYSSEHQPELAPSRSLHVSSTEATVFRFWKKVEKSNLLSTDCLFTNRIKRVKTYSMLFTLLDILGPISRVHLSCNIPTDPLAWGIQPRVVRSCFRSVPWELWMSKEDACWNEWEESCQKWPDIFIHFLGSEIMPVWVI